MKYELIALKEMDYGEGGKKENTNVALIKRKANTKYPEYAVVRNLDRSIPMERDDQWSNTIGYWHNDIRGLASAVDLFRQKTEENYISRARLEELATRFKDYAFELAEETYDTNDIIEDLQNEYDMTDYELEFFGMEKTDNESEN